ncbi:MAG: ABC transporter substrate-binding protein [Thermodesulfobacteriota bacterium]
MKQGWLCILGCVGVICVLWMEGMTGRAGAAQTPGRVLKFAVHTSRLGSLDPHLTRGSQDYTYADLMFNCLIRYAPGNFSQLEPDIAESIPEFKLENGRQIWTVHLKKGVLFHSGPDHPAYELTADDVIFSFKKLADPDFSSMAGEYAGMTFVKQDDHTLEIILEKPVSPLFFLPKIANLRGGYILSEKAIRSGGYDAFLAHPVGTGPFMFHRYVPGEKCELKAHAGYFRGTPKLAGVEMHFIPDNDIREAAFVNGEMDLILGVGEPGWIERMEKIPASVVDVFGPGFTGLFHFNTSIPPLDDIRVRQAIAHALDRNDFLKASSPRLVTPVRAPMSANFMPGGLTNEKVTALGLNFEKDLEKAGKLLAEAGFPDGFSMTLYGSEKRLFRTGYEILQRSLKEIGIVVDLKIVPHSGYHQMIRDNRNAMVLYFTLRPNADTYLRGFFHSDAIVTSGNTAYTNFSHCTSVDQLLDKALVEMDPKNQIRLWEQAQIKILHDLWVYPLLDIKYCVIRKSDLDYGHDLFNTLAGYPQFDERTAFVSP